MGCVASVHADSLPAPAPLRKAVYFEEIKETWILDSIIGQGQWGVVMLAHRDGKGVDGKGVERAAVKVVRKSLHESGNRIVDVGGTKEVPLMMVKNEIDLMKMLNRGSDSSDCDNIVKLLAYQEDEQYAYVMQEACLGGDVFDVLLDQPRQRFTEPDGANIVSSVTQALASCHRRNIIHRDIKPDNLVLTERDIKSSTCQVKLIDFGMSVHVPEGSPRPKDACGTLGYRAPDVGRSLEYDMKADIWSLGCLTYALLFGQFPFDDRAYLADDLHSFPAVTFPQDSTDVSEDAKDFCRTCLQPFASKRPTAATLLEHPFLFRKFRTDSF
jgi:serine/threonine protein kinase